jgi:hypothetical protein
MLPTSEHNVVDITDETMVENDQLKDAIIEI